MGKAGVKRGAGLALTVLIGGALSLAACASRTFLPVNDDGGRTALPAGGVAAIKPPPAPATQSAVNLADQCGAGPLQYLVGKDKDEIPVALVPSRRRVVCTTCPATMDMRPDRQTIRYDDATKKVTSVTCG